MDSNGELAATGSRTAKDEKPEAPRAKPEVVTDISVQKDGGWGWLIALGSFVSHVLAGGFERSGGVLYLIFRDKYGGSAAGTAWVVALFSSFRYLFGPLASALVNRFTGRTVVFCGALLSIAGLLLTGYMDNLVSIYFSYGVLSGFGSSMSFTPGVIMVGQYFTKRRGVVIGLVTVGIGIGTCMFPPLTQFLFENFGFQGTFLLLSGIMSHYLVVSALYRPLALHRRLTTHARSKKRRSKENGTTIYVEPLLSAPPADHQLSPIPDFKQEFSSLECFYPPPLVAKSAGSNVCIERKMLPKHKPEGIFNLSLLRDFVFVCVCVQSFLFLLSFNITVTFLPALVKDRGLTVFQGSTLISTMGISGVVARTIVSVLLDLKPFRSNRRLVYNGFSFSCVIVSTLLPYMTQYWQFLLLCAVYGVLTGAYMSQYYAIAIDVVGVENISSCVGIALGFNGISGLVGPAIGGLLRDYLGSYSPAFYFGSAGLFLSGSTMALGNFCFHRRIKRSTK